MARMLVCFSGSSMVNFDPVLRGALYPRFNDMIDYAKNILRITPRRYAFRGFWQNVRWYMSFDL
jgi:hypothetical protein